MRALVTGANGFTGSHLVKALIDRGHTVVALVRKTSDLSRLEGLPVEFAYGDVTDTDAVKQAMSGIDWVFHVAAYVELGVVDAARMERVNVQGTANVLAAARAAQVQKMLYCSTIGVYGDTQGRVIDETFQRTQKDFSSAYDSTKYKAQQLVDQAVAEGFSVVSVMPSGIFGPDDPHFGPVLQAFRSGKLKVWAGGDRITGIVHVDDLVDLMLLAIEKAPSGAHYIASAGEMTTREMFQIVGEANQLAAPAEMPPPVVRIVGNLLDPIGRVLKWQPPISKERVHYLYDRCVRVDGSKAIRELGWQPRSPEVVIRELASLGA
ncbi:MULTISPECIES: NAD-dependent epimerase/dehydratase family protein [unclassified Leptolyngbya]|uniref:NAD-dependent epimerase/dehydratase family protein n=1 Tax=unclassified Leptolyngbya TaxID=2650499 RepID=UPI0016870552|nr:NAD-dependent epimerase/dehydratase family protein [Leptolyngbya sp. FACHB-8]MBD1912105.1 NAD-dependent epimerase/dehydratase family protein [Leptolyngbya sp. FACHB-8]MBD2154996.1 NAD-dependent epimerase/dehydratase family protein [Leptolyngbya sp. FACHB-16]